MPVVVDLRARIDAVRDMLAPSLRGNINFTIDIEDKIWPVEADLGELELALVNIAVNARDAMPDGGTITLQARNVALQAGSAAGPQGEFVALAMIDNGTGIAPNCSTGCSSRSSPPSRSARAPGSGCRRCTASPTSRAAR